MLIAGYESGSNVLSVMPFGDAPAVGRAVSLAVPGDQAVNARIVPDDKAMLKETLEHVWKSTDPVAQKGFLMSTPFFLRDYRRRKAALDAFDKFKDIRDKLRPSTWFRAFVLLDRLGPKDQLRAFNAYLARVTNDPEWSLEVIRRWLVRDSVGRNAALRSSAIAQLIRIWEAAPVCRPAAAQLLAYLLCSDPAIGREQRFFVRVDDYRAVEQMLVNSKADGALTDPEAVVAAGLLQAAREVDAVIGWGARLETSMSEHVGKSLLERAGLHLHSLRTFAEDIRMDEACCKVCVRYSVERREYEQRQERSREAWESAISKLKAVVVVIFEVGAALHDLLLRILLARALVKVVSQGLC